MGAEVYYSAGAVRRFAAIAGAGRAPGRDRTVQDRHHHALSARMGYVVLAAGLILVSAVNRKFYCKYLCPLGAALTIPGKFRIFEWLRRHRECGRPCHVCAVECEVRAIRKNGEINANECHYCLDCQVTYWNDRKRSEE